MFHVPEEYRITDGRLASNRKIDGNNGAFSIPHPDNKTGNHSCFNIIASDGMGWEHVSVSRIKNKVLITPTWYDMCFVKNMFWEDEDTVIQFHPMKSQYVNKMEVLHLWRPIGTEVQLPPSCLVG